MAKITSTDEWVDAAIAHLKKIEETGERYNFTHSLIYNLALWGGYNTYEMVGMLECIKAELLEDMTNSECDGDCDNCDQRDKDE